MYYLKIRYFTEIGVSQIFDKYSVVAKKAYICDKNGNKANLDFIYKQVTSFKKMYNVMFVFENLHSLTIYNFMKCNPDIEYDFKEFDTKIVNL
jgi:hypothetical protein